MIKSKIAQIIMISLFFSLLVLVATNSHAESLDELTKKQPVTVSFFIDVAPGTTAFSSGSAQMGATQTIISEVNEQLVEGKTLIVKSISVTNFSIPFPNPDSFSAIAFGSCTQSLAITGFGNSGIATYGSQSNTMYFNPGLVAYLPNKKNELCIKSNVQSNEKARVFIHGILLDKF